MPILVAEGIRAAGHRVACVGFRGMAEPALPDHCDTYAPVGFAQVWKWSRLLRQHGVREAIMVGRVQKLRIHDPFYLARQIPDLGAARIWFGRLRKDRRTDSILGAIADELESTGVRLINSTIYIQEHLAPLGSLTGDDLPSHCLDAIRFGRPIVQRMGALDIGQSLAVTADRVIAVEAVEGTDAMIERAGELAAALGLTGWVLIKMAKPNQDMRFDVPTIGPRTIENLHAAGASCLAVEANKVIILDRTQTLKLCRDHGISMIGISQNDSILLQTSPRAETSL